MDSSSWRGTVGSRKRLLLLVVVEEDAILLYSGRQTNGILGMEWNGMEWNGRAFAAVGLSFKILALDMMIA